MPEGTVPLNGYASDPLGGAAVVLGGTARRGAAVFIGGFSIRSTGTFRGAVVSELERDELSTPQLGDFVIVDTLMHQQVLQQDGWVDAEDTIAMDKPPVLRAVGSVWSWGHARVTTPCATGTAPRFGSPWTASATSWPAT